MKYSASARAILAFCVALFATPTSADIYGHNPRMSNNRLRESNGNTQNQNRLFNSQNNANGGYCWGPPMTFYAESKLSVEWTAQHSCGNNNAQCQIILQYMCTSAAATTDGQTQIRDGSQTGNNPTTITTTNLNNTGSDGSFLYGMHEPLQHYLDCNARSRNKGLFIADQTINGNNAQFTRQNQNGGQRGFECQEERDYYPYWHPSPWKDIAVLTTQTDVCGFYQSESQNVKAKYYCQGAKTNPQPVNEQECRASAGTWVSVPSWGIGAPECMSAPWSRDNHLGNGPDGQTNRYNWTMPNRGMESCLGESDGCVCVLRIRYNITTAEIQGFGGNFTDLRSNGIYSPITEDPDVMVGGQKLTLAVATNQYGRTFQDRSHAFNLKSRPSGIPSTATIWNLNVRGKRGNIVETFPSTEYDYAPSHLMASVGDYVHFQWTGCDTNPAGNAGNGRDQTDRSNIVQIADSSHNLPLHDSQTNMFDSASLRDYFAYLGQVDCKDDDALQQDQTNNGVDIEDNPQNCKVLNAASAHFDGGLIKMNKTGTFHFMNSRSNNFSNRSQKGAITVSAVGLAGWQIGLISAAAIVVSAGAATAGCVVYAKKRPHSKLAGYVSKVPGLNRI